eukprot:augustus_masked-scaffold_3-processed-gene-7.55-mRNA-1 protein AED:0.54 eAED:0.54 QI:0/-1/0/1/-1/1/1/0/152
MYGLKGQLDVLAEVEFLLKNKKTLKTIVTIEIKTGHKIRIENYGQVLLYDLLIQDKYAKHPGVSNPLYLETGLAGVILHVKHGESDEYGTLEPSLELIPVPRNTIEQTSLLVLRNKLAFYSPESYQEKHGMLTSINDIEEISWFPKALDGAR